MNDTVHTTGDALAPSNDPANPRPARQRRVLTWVLVGVSIVMVIAAVGAGVVGAAANSAADREHDRARALERKERVQSQVREWAVSDRRDLSERADAVVAKLDDLGVALDNMADASNRFSDATIRSADQFNAGDVAGSEATFRGEGATAHAEMAQRAAELRAALDALHRERNDLEEMLS